jgi:hypothetical protein
MKTDRKSCSASCAKLYPNCQLLRCDPNGVSIEHSPHLSRQVLTERIIWPLSSLRIWFMRKKLVKEYELYLGDRIVRVFIFQGVRGYCNYSGRNRGRIGALAGGGAEN